MKHRIPIAIALSLPLLAHSHPGQRDKDGCTLRVLLPFSLDLCRCHSCRSNCEKWNVKSGKRHCRQSDGTVYYPDEKQPESKSFSASSEYPTPNTQHPRAQRAYIEKVYDGDTVLVRKLPGGERLKIRLLGIDCPESHPNKKCAKEERSSIAHCWQDGHWACRGKYESAIAGRGCDWLVPQGMRASKAAALLLKRQTVTLECGKKCGVGNYGRALRYIRLPGPQADKTLEDGTKRRGLGLEMIEQGLCEDFGWKYPHPRQEKYLDAQNEARKKNLGIWSGWTPSGDGAAKTAEYPHPRGPAYQRVQNQARKEGRGIWKRGKEQK